MTAAWTIARREIGAFFVSPTAYVVLTVWLAWCGMTFYLLLEHFATSGAASGSGTPLSAFFGGSSFFYMPLLVFVPVLTMRLLAEETRSGTIEPLLTAPITELDIVLGKYAAAVVFWIVLWAPTGVYVWICSRYGSVDLGVIGATYVGVLGLGLHYMAIGVAMSAVAKNQIVAALLTFMVLGLMFALGIYEYVAVDESKAIFAYVSVWTHLDSFSRGMIDSRHLVYDLSLTALFLFVAVRVLEGRRLA